MGDTLILMRKSHILRVSLQKGGRGRRRKEGAGFATTNFGDVPFEYLISRIFSRRLDGNLYEKKYFYETIKRMSLTLMRSISDEM